jgi:16S rRNA (cytidine1402-2'-O)-methyltransferase
MSGTLYLVPNLLGIVPPESVLPAKTIAVARRLDHFIVENAKPARAFLKSLDAGRPMREIAILELGVNPPVARLAELLAPARQGHDVGLMSDAGCPGIADPGALVVAEAHRNGISVVPLVGPSSVLLALMASGMNGQGFTFHGYLAVKPSKRAEALRALEAESRRTGRAQLFIETPYRNAALLASIVEACNPSTRLCVAADLTLESETVESRAVREWKGRDFTRYAKRPAMFVLQGSGVSGEPGPQAERKGERAIANRRRMPTQSA